MTTTAVNPVLLLTGVVRRVERLSPSFVRVMVGGDGFEHLGPEGPTLDQRVKLLIPNDGHAVPTDRIDPDSWYAGWLALPEQERGHLRTYTARAIQGEGRDRQLVVDFVLHGDGRRDDRRGGDRRSDGLRGADPAGPAATWAHGAQPGDQVGVLAPRRGHERGFGGVEFAPGSARRLVLVADETAVPALASIAESLPADAEGFAVIEVPTAADFLEVRFPPGIERHWVARGARTRGQQTLALLRECLPTCQGARSFGVAQLLAGADPDEVVWETPVYSSSGADVAPAADVAYRGDDSTALPRSSGRFDTVAQGPNQPFDPSETYAWVAGDSDTVKACRRLLVGDLGLPRQQVAFMGYWKVGRSG